MNRRTRKNPLITLRDAIARSLSTASADGFIDFTTKPDGDPPAVLDTGQPVDYVLQLVSNRKPQISGGKLVAADVGTTSYADYYQAQFDGNVLSAGTQFTINTVDGSTQGVVCLAVWDGMIEGSGTLIPKSPAHITVDTLTGQTTWWVNDGLDNTHLKGVKQWNITPPASNGTAVWELAVWIDPATGTGRMKLPGPVSSGADIGQTIVSLTDAEISTFFTAYYPALPVPTFANMCDGCDVAMVEHQCNATANTARMPRFLNMWGNVARAPRQADRDLRQFGERFEVATHGAASKVTPTDNDEFPLVDSEAGYGRKRVTWANLRALIITVISGAPMTMASKTLTTPRMSTILDTNGAGALTMSATASAVNYIQLISGATGVPAGIRATGTDTNINLNLRGKGTGVVTAGSGNSPVLMASDKAVANGVASLDANGRVPTEQLTVDAMQWKGTWNASTNTPTLADGTGSPGDTYRVTTAGTANLGSGAQTFDVGDWVILSASNVWEKADMTDAVASVAGLTGTITAAALRTALALVIGTNVQAYDADLDAIAALAAANDDFIQRKGGVWVNRTRAQVVADLLSQGLPYDISYLHSTGVRAAGLGANPMGIRIARSVLLTSVTYRCAVADGSGNLVVVLHRNGSPIAASSATIAAANQVAGGTAAFSQAFSAGDILTVSITSVGTTPGSGLIADVTGVTA